MKIVHISDLHFGTEKKQIMADLQERIRQIAADLVIISGDFTQTASRLEFAKARAFIDSLKAPVFCVPGNHDIPRFNLWERLFYPLRKYRHWIESDLAPVFINQQVVIAGMNTARRALFHWNWANGAISSVQLKALQQVFKAGDGQYKICVLHHPIHKARESPLPVIVFGAQKAVRTIEKLKMDLVLTGHVHHASLTIIDETVFLSASTAISDRLRKQENGFNLIEFHKDFFEVMHFTYGEHGFVKTDSIQHKRR